MDPRCIIHEGPDANIHLTASGRSVISRARLLDGMVAPGRVAEQDPALLPVQVAVKSVGTMNSHDRGYLNVRVHL